MSDLISWNDLPIFGVGEDYYFGDGFFRIKDENGNQWIFDSSWKKTPFQKDLKSGMDFPCMKPIHTFSSKSEFDKWMANPQIRIRMEIVV